MHEEAKGADASAPTGGCPTSRNGESAQALETVKLSDQHLRDDFRCERSARVEGFLRFDKDRLVERNYAKVFVLPSPDDACRILGYYTLSATVFDKHGASTQHQKRIPGGLGIPMALIGFMGRSDGAKKGTGAALIADAALRVSRISDLGIWGLTLIAEREELLPFYQSVGFQRVRPERGSAAHRLTMYGPLKTFIE